MDDVYGISEDSYETRKRGRLGESDLVQYPKRIAFGTKPGHLLLKVLVPTNVAGTIIGKSGAQIKELQTNYEVGIKLSQNNQFYPENRFTNSERIVIVTGAPDKLVNVAEFIHAIIRNPPQARGLEPELMDSRRQSQMKIVVTNTTAGMVIGKGGETIKALNIKYDVRIQISQKDDFVMGERVISISGPEDGVNRSVEFIIKEKLRDDPTSTSITNLDYSAHIASTQLGDLSGTTLGQSNSLSYNSFDNTQDMNNVGLLQTLLTQNQQSSQASQQTYSQQPQTYSSYPGNAQSQNSAYNSMPAVQHNDQQQSNLGGGSNASDALTRVLAQALTSNMNNSLATALVQALAANAGGNQARQTPRNQAPLLQAPQVRQQLRSFISRPDDVKFRVAVPDSLVGRILGRAGCTITEIQNTTGCEIKFSQRGEYMPGTQNRILYITGQPTSCTAAQQLVLQKMEGDSGDVSTSDFTFEQIKM